jgi:Methyltransferase domain
VRDARDARSCLDVLRAEVDVLASCCRSRLHLGKGVVMLGRFLARFFTSSSRRPTTSGSGAVPAPVFECPICHFVGLFADVRPHTGLRKHAKCPGCGALERHRLQYLVMSEVLKNLNSVGRRLLHFAPEPFFRDFFSKRFDQYDTADLLRQGVDYNVDLQALPMDDATYDCVFASHVLEHVPDDRKAISEIRRILRPGGMAVLPVPLLAEHTVEYPEPNPMETYHVRAPGFDYYERYEQFFSRIERYSSDSLPEKFQLYVYEDRTHWPTKECPLRPSMPGERHIDIVPVCYV